ncbi:MAG TPA: sulfite exporter TauE/SafE family protein, partial [Ilumatobacter sp.]|nr:sulfite exporter TauE/SafE family protein [Ilumatobacter sp.]
MNDPSEGLVTTPMTPPVAAEPAMSTHTVRVVLVGLVAGFLSGLFGVGGGILIVPALVLLLGFTQRLAHGTSLAAVLPIAIASLTSYAVEDKVDWKVGALLAVGAVAGAVIGTHILHRLPHDMLAIIFAVLLVATAVRLLFDHSDAGGRGDLHPLTIVSLVIVGLITGVLAGLLGVGGGIFVVPAMVVGYGIPAAVAKGTSLAMIVPTSIVGTWRNRANRNVDLRVAVV